MDRKKDVMDALRHLDALRQAERNLSRELELMEEGEGDGFLRSLRSVEMTTRGEGDGFLRSGLTPSGRNDRGGCHPERSSVSCEVEGSPAGLLLGEGDSSSLALLGMTEEGGAEVVGRPEIATGASALAMTEEGGAEGDATPEIATGASALAMTEEGGAVPLNRGSFVAGAPQDDRGAGRCGHRPLQGQDGRRGAVEELRRELRRVQYRVETVENALQVLDPEERLVADWLFVYPRKGNVQRLCQALQVEKSSVYRKRERMLRKLAVAMFGQ